MGPHIFGAIVSCDGNRRFRAVPFLISLRAQLRADNALFAKGTSHAVGTVKFFDIDKGYGFISPECGGNDSFVHISAVERAGMTLNANQRLSYEIDNDQRGKSSAVNLKTA